MVYSKLPPLYSFLEDFNNLKETKLYYDEKVGGTPLRSTRDNRFEF